LTSHFSTEGGVPRIMKKTLVLCCLSALLGGLAVAFGLHHSLWFSAPSAAQETTPWSGQAAAGPTAATPGNAVLDALTPEERVNVFVYQKANRGVVNINTEVPTQVFPMIVGIAKGAGSGVVVDRDGHILTNLHVVQGARQIHVTLFDGNTYDGKLIGGDPETDVAVLHIDAPAESLFPVEFGSSSHLLVGQRVYAIGNPFALERTLSTGIISSLGRAIQSPHSARIIKSIIQIDAAVNPGNSGGPLLDTHARMIGMNMAIASKTGGSEGVGFAIPINTIARVVPQLIRNGRVRRPDSGIVNVLATDHGLLIETMVPGGAAERAGLQGRKIVQKRQGFMVLQTVDRSHADLIVAVDGQPIKNADDFLSAIEAKQPGDQVILTVIRDGRQQQIPLRLD
jgi:S1-C subfamily serine protease